MICKISSIIKIYKIINLINKEKLYKNCLKTNNKTIRVYNFLLKIRLAFKMNKIVEAMDIDTKTEKIDILKKINNYLKENIEFDKQYSAHLDPQKILLINRKLLMRRTAYNAIVHKCSACMGYAETLRILLKYYDIESKTILALLPQKEIDVNKYIKINKSFYFDSKKNKYYPLSIYSPITINGILYKGFAHFSTIVFLDNKEIILDPDRQRNREKKGIKMKDIVFEIKHKMKYIYEIPDNYDPITEKLLGSELSNIAFKIKENKNICSIIEL